MNIPSLISAIGRRLQSSLPGWHSQWELTPLPGRGPNPLPDRFREAAVLSLLYPRDGELSIVLMKRTEDGRTHSGQVSLPGGKHEASDPDLKSTALREAEEELGIPAQEVQILGDLTELYIHASNYLVQPVVGFVADRPTFRPSPLEVQEIIEISIPQLLQTPVTTATLLDRTNSTFYTRAFQIEGQVIWGATAMMLNELLTIIREESS